MRSELKELKEVRRPAVVAALAEARSHGDLRENAEYAAAKERQRFVEARVSMLRSRVSQIQLMNLEKIVSGAGMYEKVKYDARASSSIERSKARSVRIDFISDAKTKRPSYEA